MSQYFSAAQYEQDYLPKRLGNWQTNQELERKCGSASNRYSTLQPPLKAPTLFMVDDRGHLKPGVKKINNSFRLKIGPADAAPTRWPKPSLTVKAAPAATMGYKGYLSTTSSGKPVYDGVVATRLPRRNNNAQSSSSAAPAAAAAIQAS